MTLAIIILNWNNFEDTDECLSSLHRADLYGGFIVLVDNDSKDSSYERLRQKWSSWSAIHWIKNKENLGFAGGNNVGISYALAKGAEYIMLLNNDTVVNPDFLKPLIEYMAANDNVGIVGPKIFLYSHPDKFQSAGCQLSMITGRFGPVGGGQKDNGQYNMARDCAYLTGAALMISRKCIEKIGLLDADYFAYCEEVDFCFRARIAGFRVVYVPGSKIWHKVSSSTERLTKGSSLQLYLIFRNKLIFYRKHAKLWHWVAFLPFHFYRSVRTIICSKAERKAVIQGVLDGMIGRGGKPRWF
ncbi:Glycosyltransferase [Dissulfuribacter thermophilus]|uniref:Glycosyltransferase n=1 Tax=Dissulfuribacter thermophilus TaxID=1156395 RepID=A0A1B9F3Z7_9BACT|nr:glycosyltransferase family 2 protein [Dissulfuribacter thermophilus]OCC14667.1 Glycosyltransferase [Dissulfuribacter thermophilus]